ncbi:Structural maintenance of chromosomes protein 5, partial [Coemansia sp. BCRC 34301]
HEYRAGSIMHISLTNFITYDRIDVRPGPHMNMIIGPNGTGKSSIVCAIALGLGENTSVMKRAKDISEFVKHGHDHGTIEITLATGTGTVVIRREMTRQDNKSVWKIDGRAATFGDVQKRTRDLHIQVNNLCQFLPQDRVVEFSKMSAQALLKQTQAAVGRDDLRALQDELVARRGQERQAMRDAERLRGDAEALRKQTAVLERDVKRWEDRVAAESQLRVLEALVPVARYAEAKAAHDAAKREKSRAHAHYLAMRDSPASSELEQRIAGLDSQLAGFDAARKAAGDRRKDAELGARQQVARLERLEVEQRQLDAEVDTVRSQARRRQEQVAALRSEVARLEEALGKDRPPEEEGEGEGESGDVSALRSRMLELANELVAVGDEQRALMSAGRQISGELEQRLSQLRGLDDEALRRREDLRRVHDDSVRALEWLEQNRGLFAQHVFGPVCLEASVRDPRLAAGVESVVSRASLRTFVAQCDADYHVFTRNVNDALGLRVSVASVEGARGAEPPHPRAEIVGAGFAGYAEDLVDAPRAVVAFLRSRDSIHAVPVALGAVDHAAAERLQLRAYVAGGTRFATARGRYGSRAPTITATRISARAALLGGSGESDDVRAARARLQAEAGALRDTLAANEAQMKRLARAEHRARDAHRQAEARDAEHRARRRARADARAAWERRAVHVATRRAQLHTLLAAPGGDGGDGGSDGGVAAAARRAAQGQRDNARGRARALADGARHVTAALSALHSLAASGLAGFGVQRSLAECRAQALRLRALAADAQAALGSASDAFNAAKAAAREALEATRLATEGMTEDERQAVRAEQDRRGGSALAADDVATELATCRQRLSLADASGVSSAVMAQYAERQSRLTRAIAQAQHVDAELLRIRRHKLHALEKWEQPLTDIVAQICARFRAMFDHIQCLGEVCLRKDEHEDYDNWGIEIRVAFRKNEAPQPLDNHRQSGGERAVSTILYLQALQSLVAAPFRVVDEINQGMDERNERLVHSLIVDSACQQGSPQYFLITPKLLPDLEYHPLMKVLCIFNGEWQPESFNFGKYISNARMKP